MASLLPLLSIAFPLSWDRRTLLSVASAALPSPLLREKQESEPRFAWSRVEGPGQYAVAMLPNGARCVVSSDDSLPRCELAVSVACGSLDDPEEWEGLAHLTEHLTLAADPAGLAQAHLSLCPSSASPPTPLSSLTLVSFLSLSYLSTTLTAFPLSLDHTTSSSMSPLFTLSPSPTHFSSLSHSHSRGSLSHFRIHHSLNLNLNLPLSKSNSLFLSSLLSLCLSPAPYLLQFSLTLSLLLTLHYFL